MRVIQGVKWKLEVKDNQHKQVGEGKVDVGIQAKALDYLRAISVEYIDI